MPVPDEIISRFDQLLPGIPFAETIPLAERPDAYHAFVNFGGLILSVEAPCGCKIHYDTSELTYQTHHNNCLEACLREECEFEYATAELAALKALGEFTAHGPDYDIGGES